jgi:hypothetical protein
MDSKRDVLDELKRKVSAHQSHADVLDQMKKHQQERHERSIS